MEILEYFLELSGGTVLLIGFGALIGHLLKLDKFGDERKESQQFQMKRTDTSTKEPGDFVQNNDF